MADDNAKTVGEALAEKRALQLFLLTKFRKLAGQTVVFKREVDRQPYFTVPAGATAVLQEPCLDDDGDIFLAAKLTEALDGAHEFDNEVHWVEELNLTEFEDDLELA